MEKNRGYSINTDDDSRTFDGLRRKILFFRSLRQYRKERAGK